MSQPTLIKRLKRPLILLASVFAIGTIGYHFISNARWWDAFYMTVITLTTVGYREVFPLSWAGQAFTIILLCAGLGLLFVVVMEIGRTVLEVELRYLFGKARRSRVIERMSGHEIVCGYGRVGRAVVHELQQHQRKVVVVERSPERVQALHDLGIPVISGEAAAEATLRAAGVERARGLVACLNDDAHNVYTVLIARSLNPKLVIVARACEEGAEERIIRAGANRSVNPYHLGGARLGQILVKPAVVDFVEFSMGPSAGVELQLQEMLLTSASILAGHNLAELDIRRKWGVGVVAVQRGHTFFPNPEADLKLEAGDVLIIIGTKKQLEQLTSAAALDTSHL